MVNDSEFDPGDACDCGADYPHECGEYVPYDYSPTDFDMRGMALGHAINFYKGTITSIDTIVAAAQAFYDFLNAA